MKSHKVKDNYEIQEWVRRLCGALLRWIPSRLRQPDSLFCGGRFANANYSPFSFPILTSIFAPASRQNILRPVTLPGSVKWTTHHVSVVTSSCNYCSSTAVCIICCHRKHKYDMFLKSSIWTLMKDTVLYSNECNDLDCKHFFKQTKSLSVVVVGKPILFIGFCMCFCIIWL